MTLDDGGPSEDATLLAQQLLSAVARVHGRLGMKMAVALLRGEHGRIRDVAVASDGAILALTDADDGALLRITLED